MSIYIYIDVSSFYPVFINARTAFLFLLVIYPEIEPCRYKTNKNKQTKKKEKKRVFIYILRDGDLAVGVV
jgi:hypothetical protein